MPKNIFENFLWTVWKITPEDLGIKMTGNPDANQLGDLKEACFEKLLELYEENPDNLDDELRGLVEHYLAFKEDGYGSG